MEQDNIEVTDWSRETPARGWTPTTVGRTMRVLVLHPGDAPEPRPLVVFAHGFNSEPEDYLPLLDTWTQAGYVVAAPELPGSARDLPGPATRDDIGGAARDLSFVVTAMLARSGSSVDPSQIVLAGHSDGGSSVATAALNTNYRDPRIAAYLVLSGVIPTEVTDGAWTRGPAGRRVLVVVGTSDEYGNLEGSTGLYDRVDGPKVLVTVPGGDHLGMYIGDGDTADIVRATTTRLLDSALSADSGPRGPNWFSPMLQFAQQVDSADGITTSG